MNIRPIFPVFFAEEILEIDTDQLVAYTENLRKSRPGYHKNGWQSGHIDYTIPELQPLISAVENRIQTIKSAHGFSVNAEPRISDVWINVNDPGPQTANNAEPHIHANHWISFVFYVKASPESGKLILINPVSAMEYSTPTGFIEHDTEFNSHRYMVYSTTGLLVVFPGYVMHYVEPNFSDESRISIAINVTLNHVNARFVA